jgi:hypothetical protein
MILKRVAENAVVEEQDGILRISECKVLDVPRVVRFMTVGAIPDSIISYSKIYCEVTTEDRHLFTIHDRHDRMGHFLRVRSYGKEKIGEDQELKTVWRMLELCGLMRVRTSFFEICRGRHKDGLRDNPYYASGSYNREWLL